MIINAGIAKIIYEEEYNDPLANELLSETNIEIVKLEKIK
jgi:deoxycytidylate deaminase